MTEIHFINVYDLTFNGHTDCKVDCGKPESDDPYLVVRSEVNLSSEEGFAQIYYKGDLIVHEKRHHCSPSYMGSMWLYYEAYRWCLHSLNEIFYYEDMGRS